MWVSPGQTAAVFCLELKLLCRVLQLSGVDCRTRSKVSSCRRRSGLKTTEDGLEQSVLQASVSSGRLGPVRVSPTCRSSKSPSRRTVKLVELPSSSPSFLLLSSSVRKLEWNSSSWSRQGKMVWTTPASSITSSSIPLRYTPSMILSVLTWWNSVWINSEREKEMVCDLEGLSSFMDQ